MIGSRLRVRRAVFQQGTQSRNDSEFNALLKDKRDKEVESFISNELAGVTVDPDYNHIVEKTLQKQKKYTEVSACFEETQTVIEFSLII